MLSQIVTPKLPISRNIRKCDQKYLCWTIPKTVLSGLWLTLHTLWHVQAGLCPSLSPPSMFRLGSAPLSLLPACSNLVLPHPPPPSMFKVGSATFPQHVQAGRALPCFSPSMFKLVSVPLPQHVQAGLYPSPSQHVQSWLCLSFPPPTIFKLGSAPLPPAFSCWALPPPPPQWTQHI